MISFSPTPDISEEPQAIIWDVFTGQRKRSFHCPQPIQWPIFKWNKDGTYFAKMNKDSLSIYETPVSEVVNIYYTYEDE